MLGILGGIVVIRTAIVYFLNLELVRLEAWSGVPPHPRRNP
jgi:uncharacterized membrane protein